MAVYDDKNKNEELTPEAAREWIKRYEQDVANDAATRTPGNNSSTTSNPGSVRSGEEAAQSGFDGSSNYNADAANAFGENTSDSQSDFQDRVGKGFNSGKEFGFKVGKVQIQKTATKSLLKKALLPSILTGFVVAGVILFFVFQGPIRIVQLAQELQKYHYVADQTFLASRGAQLIKFSRTADTPINRNMSYFGNKFANHYETRLKDAGMTPNYGNRRIKSITIDTTKPKGREALNNMKAVGLDPSQLSSSGDGKVTVTIDGSTGGSGSARYRRLSSNAMMTTLNLGKTEYFMASRILQVRGGVNFHPLRNIARKADESIRDYRDRVKEERNKQIREGVNTDARKASAGETPNSAGEQTVDPGDASYAQEANDITDEATSSKPMEEKVSRTKANLTRGIGITGYVAMVCAVKGLSDGVGEMQQENINLPLQRIGGDLDTGAAQTQAQEDINTDELNARYIDYLDDDKGTSAENARSIQAEAGEKLTGSDMPDSAKPGKDKPPFFNTVDNVIGAIPQGNRICGAVNSEVGGWTITGLSAVLLSTGPVSALLNVGSDTAQYLVTSVFIEDILRWVAGLQIDPDAQGELYGNYVNYAYRLNNNQTALSHGGTELTPRESAALDTEYRKQDDARIQNSSFFARYLDPYEPRSLVGKAVADTPSASRSVHNVASFIHTPNLISSITKTFGNIGLTKKVNAQVGLYNYGFPEYGFTLQELDDDRYQDPYANAKAVEPYLTDLNEQYGKPCFNTIVDPTTFDIKNEGGSKRMDQIPESCKDRSNELLTRYRFYLSDLTVANCMAQYENIDIKGCRSASQGKADDTASSVPDVDASTLIDPNQLGRNSDNIHCAEGTNDLGVVETKYTGEIKKEAGPLKIRLCEIKDIPGQGNDKNGNTTSGGAVVDARVSAAWAALAKKAKSQGVQLTANSSFRLADSCGGTGDGSNCARPGQSPHQTGLAIDFGNMPGMGSSTTECSQRVRANTPEWKWMYNNATAFGIKQYTYEAWHWDPMPMSNRCGKNDG